MAAKDIQRWFVLGALLVALLAVPGVAPAEDGQGWCEEGNHYGVDCGDPAEPPPAEEPPAEEEPAPPAEEEPPADTGEEPGEATPPAEDPAPSPSHQNGHKKKHKQKKHEAPPAVSIDPPSAPDVPELSPPEAASEPAPKAPSEPAPKAPSEPAVDPVASGAGLAELGGDALRVTATGSAPTFALRAGHGGLRVRLPRASYRMGAWLRSRTPGLTVCLRIKQVDPAASSPFRVRTHEKCVQTTGNWQRVRLVLRGVPRGHQLLFSLYVYGAAPGDSFDVGGFLITRKAPHRWRPVASVRA
jgi:hypothetical protein